MRHVLSSAIVLGLVGTVLSGCSFKAAPSVAPAVNVYSTYDEKLPGKYALTIELGRADLDRTIDPSGYMCSAHDYPVELSGTLRQSIIKTVTNIVEDVEVLPNALSASDLATRGFAAQILVEATDFQARITFSQGFWSATAHASSELTLGTNVIGRNGRLAGFSAGGDGSADVDDDCAGGADALSQATEKAMREALERLAERLSDSPKIRAAGEPKAGF